MTSRGTNMSKAGALVDEEGYYIGPCPPWCTTHDHTSAVYGDLAESDFHFAGYERGVFQLDLSRKPWPDGSRSDTLTVEIVAAVLAGRTVARVWPGEASGRRDTFELTDVECDQLGDLFRSAAVRIRELNAEAAEAEQRTRRRVAA